MNAVTVDGDRDLVARSPRHPVMRALRWVAVVVLATWLLWLVLAPGV